MSKTLLKEKERPLERNILLTIGIVFRCKPEMAEEIVEQIRKSVEIIYLKQSYGKLWIKEEQQGDSSGEKQQHDSNL